MSSITHKLMGCQTNFEINDTHYNMFGNDLAKRRLVKEKKNTIPLNVSK